MKIKNKFLGWHDRGFLPHCDSKGLIQFVTFRLGDSLPFDVCQKLKSIPSNSAYDKNISRLLDSGYGSCLLGLNRNATFVEEVLLARNSIDYNLHAWVIMPNHVHTMFSVIKPLDLVMKAWKSVSSRRINSNQGGNVWYPDYFDRYIRDQAHYEKVRFYIEMNPVKANLCAHPKNWSFSSAYYSTKNNN